MHRKDLQIVPATQESIADFKRSFEQIEGEIGKAIVGMQEVVRLSLTAIFAGGHVLLEGVPGLGKTLLVKSISRALEVSFKRIQFTPDLMPSDITGTQVLTEDASGRRNFVFKPGPIFANIVLADEINRATPKTQSALLEAMEERQITVLDQTYELPLPFFVLATQNPVELEGTYPLPEAQLDRFLLKVLVPSPSPQELKEILVRTTGTDRASVEPVVSGSSAPQRLENLQSLVRQVVIAAPLQEVVVRIISALTPHSQFATPKVKQYVRFGAGPRGAQALVMAAKVAALLDGRINLAFEDIRSIIKPALRHRLILNFKADADGVTADDLIEEVRNAK